MKIDGPLHNQPTSQNSRELRSTDGKSSKKLDGATESSPKAHADSIEGLRNQLQEHPEVRATEVARALDLIKQGHHVSTNDAAEIADSMLKEMGI